MTYVSTILADTPVAYYRTSEVSGTTAFDATSNHYNAKLTGATLGGRGPIDGGSTDASILFTPTGSLAVPYTLNISAYTALSLEYWVQETGVWHYVVFTTSNATGVTLYYLDGVSATPSTPTDISLFLSTSLHSSGSNSQSGSLAEIAIYNYALSSTQVATHYLAAGILVLSSNILPSTNPAFLSYIQNTLPGQFATTTVLPIPTPSTSVYALNGTVLDSQPAVCTTPAYTSRNTLLGSSTFLLIFQSPSTNTLTLLNASSTATMTFVAANGQPVTGTVALSVSQSGNTVQVLCTLLADIIQLQA